MNYAQYLQQGGQTPSIEEQVASLVQAAIQGDRQANDQINQIMQAAEQGDQKAQQLAQLIQQVAQKLQDELPEAMKCGGKVRSKMKKACGGKVKAKVKKASCGKKMEKGGETPIKKEAKGGKPCPCTLHKVGGKLIEIDCNGIPVAKNGTKITKFESPSGPVYGDQRRYKNNRLYTFDPQMGGWYANDGLDNDEGVEEYMAQFYQPKQTVNQINPPLTSAQADHLKQNFMQGVLALDEQRRQREEEIRRNDEATARVAEEKRKAEEKKNNQYGGLFSGDLRSLQARQAWVRDNADYLRSQGWADDELNGYKGQAALNLRLANQIAGAKNWNDTKRARKVGEQVQNKVAESTSAPYEIPNFTVTSPAEMTARFAGYGSANDVLSLRNPSEEELKQQRAEEFIRTNPQEIIAQRPRINYQRPDNKRLDPRQAMYLPDEKFRNWLESTFTSTKQPPMRNGYTDYSAFFRKQGGSLNYAQYLNLK